MNQKINFNYSTYFDNELNMRKKKLNNLRNEGIPFPNNFRRNYLSDELQKKYNNKDKETIFNLNIIVSIAGRIIRKRIIGKAAFASIQDMNGMIQIYISTDKESNNFYFDYFKNLDIGDIIGVKGKLFKTKTNELTINCYKIYLLTKALRPLPDKFHGLVDKENCYRQRYLDLICNNKTKKIFLLRSKLLLSIRNYMHKKKFIEVETPMMQIIPGGANAKPFITYYNVLNRKMYLRVSPELYLKRLVVGGFERIFEINRNFRNEGISTHHNPEFTMMELYMAYANYKDMMLFIEKLFCNIAKDILGTSLVTYGKYSFDFSMSFNKQTMTEALIEHMNINNPEDLNNISKVILLAKSLNIKIESNWGLGKLHSKLFESVVENKLIQPTFITDFPTEISPLAKTNNTNNFIAERFELFIAGYEIANGFSELNDSEEQSSRFKKQLQGKNNHKQEFINFYDHDYITALEYGLPPTAGLGIGIDRMAMLFTNTHSIRDVILFPTLKPNK